MWRNPRLECMNLSLIFTVSFWVMQYCIPHSTIIDVDTDLSCLLVRHQQIEPTLVQDSDVRERPHKPRLHHGTALLQGHHPAWNLLQPSPMAVLILMHQGFTFKNSARWMILTIAHPVCLSWKPLGNHDSFFFQPQPPSFTPQTKTFIPLKTICALCNRHSTRSLPYVTL